MNNYKLINNVVGWIVFAIAAFVFCSTIEPTASFWDCGEYIACSYKLEVGHPPGAPFFLLLGRFFSLFASDPTKVAMMINIMSALCSAFTILFLYWSITRLARKMVGGEMSQGAMIAVLGSGVVGALAYTFSDSFWFSAVEGEVYAMSSFFTAIVFWAILRWEEDADNPRSDRWLVFIAYMVGLSIGVHLLNLLTIPAIVFIYYFRRFKPDPSKQLRGIIITGIVSVLILGVIQNGIIPGIVSASASYELFFVNTIGFPFSYGTLLYFVLLFAFIVTGLIYANRGRSSDFRNLLIAAGVFFGLILISSFPVSVETNMPVHTFDGKAMFMRFLTMGGVAALIYLLRNSRAVLNTIFLSFAVLLIGYSTFFVLVIRSQANTPMDENNPENAINLLSYLNREQYGDWPLLYGPYFNASPTGYADGNPVYTEDPKTGTYIISDERLQTIPIYDDELSTVFPRMWESNTSSHEREYRKWSGMDDPDADNEVVTVNEGGQQREIVKPTFGNNLQYFWRYQIGWMYNRYFMWNFVGRQNDIQGHGNLTDGNWESGFGAFNQAHMDKYPAYMKANKGANHFYYIPFLLGLIGLVFQFWRDWRNGLVVLLLFLLTGLAIVLYLNQYPLQPRERDYAYAGSFYAFAMWIGFAVYAIYHFLKEYVSAGVVAAGIPAVACMSAPVLMAKDGWDDHDRSDRYTCRDFAKNYLASCEKNAILFTNGDNDTFPLWYVQEVEGYRTDVRVVNLSLLNTDWYIDQMRRKAYDSDPVPFTLSSWETRQGTRDQVFMYTYIGRKPWAGYHSVKEVMDFVRSSNDSTKYRDSRPNENGDRYAISLSYLPTNKLFIPVNKASVKASGVVPKNTPDSLIADSVKWDLDLKKRRYIFKSDLMILDILAANDWKRPIYFAVTAGGDAYLDLDGWFQLEGLAYHLVPLKTKSSGYFGREGGVNTSVMYQHVMNDFAWGGIDKNEVYLDENNMRMTTNLRIQMMTLAEALINEGKKDSAAKVLDKCLAVLPERNVPYERTMVYIVRDFYEVGQTEKANNLGKKIFDIAEGDLRYYAMLSSENGSDMSGGEADMNRQVIGMLIADAQKYKQQAVYEEYNKRFIKLQADGIIQAEQPNQRQLMPPAAMPSLPPGAGAGSAPALNPSGVTQPGGGGNPAPKKP